MKTVELLPGGSNIIVTAENREMYVDLYVEYLLDKSIETQFNAFAKGFHKVLFTAIITYIQDNNFAFHRFVVAMHLIYLRHRS